MLFRFLCSIMKTEETVRVSAEVKYGISDNVCFETAGPPACMAAQMGLGVDARKVRHGGDANAVHRDRG